MTNTELLMRQLIDRISSTETDLTLQNQLQAIRDRLQQVVQRPQQSEIQTQLTNDWERLTATIKRFYENFSLPEIELMHDLNGQILFLEDLNTKLEFLTLLSSKKPQEVLEYVTRIYTQRQERLSSLEELGRVLAAETGRRRWFGRWKR